MPERYRMLSTVDLRNDGTSSTSIPFPVLARYPTTWAIPSALRTGEGPSIVPLTREREVQPLLSPLQREFIEPTLQREFIEPTSLTNENSLNLALSGMSLSDSNLMSLYFRFFPEHTRFIGTEFRITNTLKKKLVHLCNSIGISSSIVPFSTSSLFIYSRLGCGLRSLITESQVPKKVVEVLTYLNGKYGRLIILVSIGVGCTVWYTFVPGVPDTPPLEVYIPRVISYYSFHDVDYELPPLQKLCFIEKKYIAGEVLSAFDNVYPFKEIPIPNNYDARIPIGLGIMVAVFLAMGILPSSSSDLINLTS